MNDAKTLKRLTRLLWVLVYILSVIGIAMVIRRTLTIAGLIPSFSPPVRTAGGMATPAGPAFDAAFSQHPVMTFVHMLPGLLFLLLGPLQFMPRIRARHLRFHRRSGRVYIITSYIVGISALCMPFILSPIGGVNEAAASTLFGIFFLIAISKAWRHILKKRIALHREWMIRAYAIGLAIATVRPIMALFFAFSGLPPQVFFGTAFWLGFTLHLMAAEAWIGFTRPFQNSILNNDTA